MILANSRWLAAGAAALLLALPVQAQLKIAYDPSSEPANLQVIALRPNAVQPIYLSYYNPGPGARKNVKITVEQVGVDGKVKPLTTTVVPKVDVKKYSPVAFSLPTPKDPAAPWPKLDGPPFLLRFLVDDGTTPEPVKIDVPVKLQDPREYVKVREARYDPERRRLSFKLSSDEPLDPPCPVELVLQPSVIPGLVVNKAGTFKQRLSKENQEVELSADNVQFEGGVPPQNGRISLNVDGFERAFLYKCAFADGALTALKDNTRARLVAARYSLPSGKIPVVIEVDARSQAEGDEDAIQRSFVELKFDRAGQGNYERTPGSPYRGLRDQAVEYKADGDALVFRTKVRDRVVELDAEGINGKRTLQVRLLDAKQRVVPIANEQDARDEKVALFNAGPENRFAPLTFDKINDAVVAELILDATPAEGLKIVNVPAKARPEDKLIPRLLFTPRLRGTQAPVENVVFFLGEADKDHKIPEKLVKIEAIYDKKLDAFVPKEEIIVPAEHRGKLFVSAQVETATGVFMSGKQSLVIVSKDLKDDAALPDVLTTISGTVMRGGLAQPNVTVFLVKQKPEKTDEAKQAKTTPEGKYEFTDVPPGNYVVSARRLDTGARLPITVPKNKDKMGGVDLSLKVQ